MVDSILFLYSTASLIIILLIWNAYLIYKTKKMIKNQIDYERNPYYSN